MKNRICLERSKKKSKFLPGDPGSSAMDVVEGTVTDSDLGGPTEELADSPTAALVEELSSQDGLATDQPIDLVPETQPTMAGIQTSASIADEIQIAGMHDVLLLISLLYSADHTLIRVEFCPTALKPNEEVAPVHEASAAIHEDEVHGPRCTGGGRPQNSLFLGVLVMELREWRRKLTLRLRGGTLVPRTSSLRISVSRWIRIIRHVSLTDFSCAELVFNLN
nr:hypothetical protein Iba_chr12bCG14650 [Ipomoea batatas]